MQGSARRNRYRHALVRGLLTLALVWICPLVLAGSAQLDGAWREVRHGDTPQAVVDELAQARLSRFDPTRLHSMPDQGLGSWVALQLRSSPLEPGSVLSIYPPPSGQVTLYDGNGPLQSMALDDFSPVDHGHGRLAFRLPDHWSAAQPLLLKLEPSGSLAAPIGFRIEDRLSFWQRDMLWLAYTSACLAVMLAMALMALPFALMLRDWAFAWYAGYLVCYAALQALQTGYVFHPLEWTWLVDIKLAAGSIALVLAVVCAALFMTQFCKLPRYSPRLHLALLALCAAMILVVLLRASQIESLVHAAQALINPLLILGSLLMLAISLAAGLRGSRYAWYFLAGWAPLLLLTALSSAQVNGALSGLNWLGDACLGAGAFEALVLSVGLADRALTARRDRDLVRQLANTDALTNILNRRGWTEGLRHALQVRPHRPQTLLFMDLDHFKALNDCHGHTAGDRALVAVADILRTELRPADLLGRYGGEEFVALLDGLEAQHALQVATRLCRRVHRLELPIHDDLRLSISIGIAVRLPGDTVESLIERADQAMYAAKLSGRNRVELEAPPNLDEQPDIPDIPVAPIRAASQL
jgi:diguanylate cyclase (GGDEF)-like protein